MKKILTFIITGSFLLGVFFTFPSCKKEDPDELLDVFLGWIGDDEDLAGIEDDINFGAATPPGSVDLSKNFPPIGDQGSYGTCVAWSVGYNHKTYMEAVDYSRTAFSSSTTFSPRYLFWSIPSNQKGADCNGTGFEPAYDVMISGGISTMAASPYTDLGDCSSSPSSSENTTASSYKIENYREVDVDLATIKNYLAQGRALSFGAKLGENFMAWNSSDVLYDDTDTYNGQHAYHAMILCGYDNYKGNNGAFRVVNSWGTGWGDNGYIWVDYSFFVSDFAFCAFVAKNFQSDPDQDGGEDGIVDDLNSGKDLMAWELYDLDNGGGLNRVAKYNAYNVGNTTIPATDDWNMIYIYYNAYNANDYGILLYDYYSDDYGNYGDEGDLFIDYGVQIGSENWYNYFDIPAGVSIAHTLYNTDPVLDRFDWPYTMPTISGEYYLVLIVDGFDAISEYDESNNYFYITDELGGPITFSNGIMQEPPYDVYSKNLSPKMGDDSPRQTVKTKTNLNSYSTKEIQAMIKNRLESGDIQKKAAEFLKTNKSTSKKTRG